MGGQPRIWAEIFRTDEFQAWFDEQPPKIRLLIKARLERIRAEGHFGDTNRFEGLVELKWASGLRVYTHIRGDHLLLVLLGGNKNGQDKDIRRAKKVLRAFLEAED